MSQRLYDYWNLLELSYDDAVDFLKNKYGSVIDDYFKKDSYNGFMYSKIGAHGALQRGHYSRTSDGLYCHHISEDKYLNATSIDYCVMQNIPFSVHEKQNLVYADLVEHLILHVLITVKTRGKFGYPGVITYLLPQMLDWYVDKNVPTDWQKNCYKASYLTPDEAKVITSKIYHLLKKTFSDEQNFTSDIKELVRNYK